ncbi:hypothetical protein HMPREF9089_01494 [Eubacterium brachy ATCC 33089]|nr:hypothetical protein HMPREF9089_01494 [Eubacterium brachy ATCC 33089]
MNAPTQLNMKFELRSIVIFLRLQRFLFVKVGKILFFLRRFIKDISDQGTVEKSFRFRPEILSGFFAVAFSFAAYGFKNQVKNFINAITIKAFCVYEVSILDIVLDKFLIDFVCIFFFLSILFR